ncbi:MAG: hypothetical protein ACFFDN_05765 [Candidatus Hodarchaeota archaeon]
MVRISLNIPQKTHERMKSLSEFYKKDIKEIIDEIIEVVGIESHRIINASKEYKIPLNLTNVVSHLFDAGVHSTNSLFNRILERLEVKGLFVQDDMEIDLDEKGMWINYSAVQGCDLYVDSFDVTLNGLARITATYILEIEKIGDTALERIVEIANNIKEVEDLKLPETFYEMEFSVEIEGDDKFQNLTVDITEESLYYLPTIPVISKIIKQILEKAGVNLPIEE